MNLPPCSTSMNRVSWREHVHARAIGTGCSHSAHFLIRDPCSRPAPGADDADQRVIRLVSGHGTCAALLIPRGYEFLDPSSLFPVVAAQLHPEVRQETSETHSFGGWSGPGRATPRCSRSRYATQATSPKPRAPTLVTIRFGVPVHGPLGYDWRWGL